MINDCLFSSPSPTLLAWRGKTIVINRLGPSKAVPIVITTLANCSTIFIISDGLHPRLYHKPIVKLIAQKIGSQLQVLQINLKKNGVNMIMLFKYNPKNFMIKSKRSYTNTRHVPNPNIQFSFIYSLFNSNIIIKLIVLVIFHVHFRKFINTI